MCCPPGMMIRGSICGCATYAFQTNGSRLVFAGAKPTTYLGLAFQFRYLLG